MSRALRRVAERLLAEREPSGHWKGELSPSALSTATAVFALACAREADIVGLPPVPPFNERGVRGDFPADEVCRESRHEEADFVGLPPVPPFNERGVRGDFPADEVCRESRHEEADFVGQIPPTPLSQRGAKSRGLTSVPPFNERGARGDFPADEVCRDPLVERGRDWLARNANPDGGWGDTPTSPSNLSTTTLCWAALAADGAARERHASTVARAEAWIRTRTGSLERRALSRAIQGVYGEDRTFSVPILTMCALAGRLGDGREAWGDFPALPFELAVLPRSWFKLVGLPVVSYALPALIAIGQAQHRHRPSRLPPLRWLRDASRSRTLGLLAEIQPESGGFLEAVPLTSFVAMSLAALPAEDAGPVIDRCAGFLAASVRDDGSWPIDVDLATWVTTLSVNALPPDLLGESERRRLVDWLLGRHHVRVHPFTQADPGGWAWTDLPGGVPDADDTAGALLALARLAPEDPRAQAAAELGVGWLLGLANRDGGIPTFCRGWGKLPFDRSAPDLTGHALRAWHAWRGRLSSSTGRRLDRAARRAAAYLERSQRADGSWVPLWFGNQAAPARENPTYGTSRVVLALAETGRAPDARRRGARWLVAAQNADGGWGGAPGVASSTEETALAVEALGAVRRIDGSPEIEEAGERGVVHLLDRIERGDLDRPAPIGLYFADLWYSEKLYPFIFAAGALGRWSESGAAPGQTRSAFLSQHGTAG